MQYFKLNNGENIPSLGFSTSNVRSDEIYNLMKNAISINCRLFFLSEESFPFAKKALDEAINDGILREEFYICTKFFANNFMPLSIENSLQNMLNALDLKYLDLFLIHFPILFKTPLEIPEAQQGFVPLDKVPISNILVEIENAKRMEFIKSFGVSNFSIERIEDFKSNFIVTPNANEIECQNFMGEENLVKYSFEKNVCLICNFQSCDEKTLQIYEKNKVFNDVCAKYHLKEIEVLYVWLRQNNACVLPKIRNVDELHRNFDIEKIRLSDEDFNLITTELK